MQNEEKGIDYDLDACLRYNPQPFTVEDIEKVLAVWEGENDGDDWRWIIKLSKNSGDANGGRFVFLEGGCDYTGWDCQSFAESNFAKTARMAANLVSNPDIRKSLIEQLRKSKNKTWREKMDEELNVKDLPKI